MIRYYDLHHPQGLDLALTPVIRFPTKEAAMSAAEEANTIVPGHVVHPAHVSDEPKAGCPRFQDMAPATWASWPAEAREAIEALELERQAICDVCLALQDSPVSFMGHMLGWVKRIRGME